MLCADVMSSPVVSVATDATVQAAARTMEDQNVGLLVVCDEKRHVVGVVTDRDLAIRVLGRGAPATTPVGMIMTHPVVVCSPTDDLVVAEARMATRRISRVVCVDERARAIGVISLADFSILEDGTHLARTMKRVAPRETHPPRR